MNQQVIDKFKLEPIGKPEENKFRNAELDISFHEFEAKTYGGGTVKNIRIWDKYLLSSVVVSEEFLLDIQDTTKLMKYISSRLNKY